MIQEKIKINEIYDVIMFVKEAGKVEGDVTLTRGKNAVDAKSLMGVMCIDMSRPVYVTYPEDSYDLEKFLIPFAIH